MCGFIAVFDRGRGRARHHESAVRRALRALSHRGPDGEGVFVGRRAVLGHRRLAVVDPRGGHQPFVDGTLAWVANAEIYNHEALGPGRADCAVIGSAWRRWGHRLPEHLDGQFAFAVTDDRTGAWLVARDPVGICPLYVGHHADGTIWFASEMKALVDHCAEVALVEPGHAYGSEGVWRWYRRPWLDACPAGRPSSDTVRAVFTAAVEKRFMADVPFGVLLSGGLDSGLVAAAATRLVREGRVPYSGRLHTFSIGLEGAPDLAPARRLAAFLGTHHHEFTFTVEEALAAVPAVVRHLESYQQVRTAVPTYLLAARVRQLGFKMVLSGEGADELLGGYLYFHHAPSAAEFHRETVRKTFRLHQFDVMRANKAPMAHGLELRFPYLDRGFVDLALSTDPSLRMPGPRVIAPRVPRQQAAGVQRAERAQMGRCDSLAPRVPMMEKVWLRAAFDDPADPWLPDDILWRQKEQFSDGVGYDWVDRLCAFAAAHVSPEAWARRAERFPEDPPATPELYWMRSLFEAEFVGRAAGRTPLATVGTGRSIACSTPEAFAWNPAWATMAGDISGRTISLHGAG